MQHIRLFKDRNQVFYGRDDIINSIKNLVTSHGNEIIVVHGISGCGKTSIMARCVSQVLLQICGFETFSTTDKVDDPLLEL